MIESIFGSAALCAFYAWTAYKKSKDKAKGEKFDWKKFGSTVIIGAVFGAIAGFTGQEYGVIETSSYAAMATIIIENGWKWFWRKVLKK